MHKLSALIIALLLVACSSIESGTVTEKQFVPAHDEHYTQSVYIGETCYGSGTSKICTPNYINIPQTRFVPDRWTIKFERCDNGEDCKDRTIEVTESLYAQLSEGDYFNTGVPED